MPSPGQPSGSMGTSHVRPLNANVRTFFISLIFILFRKMNNHIMYLTFDPYFLQSPINTIVQEMMQGQGQGPPLPNNFNSVSATPMPHVKEWHPSVDPDLRNHLVRKL